MQHEKTLRYVDAIARHRSIRRAAEAMAITPSALNRRLLALEAEFGAPLFERTARGVRLSSAGEMFIHHARRQMAEMARVRAAVEDMKGARRGHVAIAFDTSLGPRVLARMIAAHRAGHPGVTFAVIGCDRRGAAAMLADYSADLAVVVEPERDGSFATLATLPLVAEAVAAEGHDLGAGDPGAPIRLNALAAHDLALPPAGSLRFLLDAAAARREIALRPVIEGDATVTMPLIAAGVAVGVRLGLERPPADGAGDLLRPPEGTCARPVRPQDVLPVNMHLGQLRDRVLPVPAARFAEALRRQMMRDGGTG